MHNLTNHLLIASPSMPDRRFQESVIYIARHDNLGAFGFVINQALNVNMLAIFDDLEIIVNESVKKHHSTVPILDGGPLNPEVGFVLHTGLPEWSSSVAVTENVCFTTSKDILTAIATNNSVSHFHMCLGHANWQKNQLEQEIKQGDWFTIPANSEILFSTPLEKRWKKANSLAGLQLDWLVTETGRA